jgi:phosphoribosyl 1,2-cyclic phosphodiesterase
MKVEFCSLSSGSSGNCYYLGNEFHGILIDAGISAKSIRGFLSDLGLSIDKIMGILITHDHGDHIRGLQTLARRHHIPTFTSETVWNNILEQSSMRKITGDCIHNISLLQNFHLAGFDIEAFPVSHDTPETLGFHIRAGNCKITIVTDLGHICSNAARYITAANFLVIESNYDENMLLNGAYPAFLKKRISSDHGHLDNQHTSSFLAENMNEELSHICLAHLSKNNNTPEKALETIHRTFAEKGLRINGKPKIMVLKRNVPSEMISLEP